MRFTAQATDEELLALLKPDDSGFRAEIYVPDPDVGPLTVGEWNKFIKTCPPPPSEPPDPRTARHLELLADDFHGALGVAQGLIRNKQGYAAGAVAAFLERARDLMPADVIKEDLARYFVLRGTLRLDLRDEAGATRDFETAFSVWPVTQNPALRALRDLYGKAGDADALKLLETRVIRPRGAR